MAIRRRGPSPAIPGSPTTAQLVARIRTRHPRVAVNVADPADVSRYYAVRGRVVATTADGAAESIEEIAQKYLGGPYPRPKQDRLLLTIAVDRISHQPWG